MAPSDAAWGDDPGDLGDVVRDLGAVLMEAMRVRCLASAVTTGCLCPLNSSTRSGAPPRPHHRPAPGTSRGARRLRPPATSGIDSSVRNTARSARWGRVTISSLPFRITGRAPSNSTSSWSVLSWRTAKPPPVANRQSVSEIPPPQRPDTLSKASTWPLLAAMNRSRYSHSKARKGALIFVDNA
jgi:hypothetical protein